MPLAKWFKKCIILWLLFILILQLINYCALLPVLHGGIARRQRRPGNVTCWRICYWFVFLFVIGWCTLYLYLFLLFSEYSKCVRTSYVPENHSLVFHSVLGSQFPIDTSWNCSSGQWNQCSHRATPDVSLAVKQPATLGFRDIPIFRPDLTV